MASATGTTLGRGSERDGARGHRVRPQGNRPLSLHLSDILTMPLFELCQRSPGGNMEWRERALFFMFCWAGCQC